MSKIVILMLNPSVDVMLQFDEFEKSKTNRVVNEIETLGGKGLNVSLALASFGLSVCLTGFVGKDRQGEFSKILKEKNIEDALVCVDGKTRTNFKLSDLKEGSVTEANGQGFCVSESDVSKLLEQLKKQLCDAEILVLTGSVPKGVDFSIYARCIEIANEKGIKTILDASGDALKLGIDKKPYSIKPNIDELSQVLERDLKDEKEIAHAMEELLCSGIELAVVSMGKDGAMFAKGGKIYKANTFKVDVKSTVGAGDSMVAAMCYALANDMDIKKTARLAVSAGCITTGKIATELCTAEEVFENEEKVDVLEVEL